MADLLVSGIQHRRGEMVDLPQPLRPGEMGWCLDTGRLFIGTDETTSASGVKIFPGLIGSAQTILDEQIIAVDTSGDGDFDFDDFVTFMGQTANFPNVDAVITPVNPTVSPDKIINDEAAQVVYVGLSAAQSDSGAGQTAYLTDIVGFDAGLAPAVVSYTISPDGGFSTSTHDIANILSDLMNAINDPTVIANTNLNVEVYTTESLDTEFEVILEDIVVTPVTYTLAASGTFIDFPAGGLSYDITDADTLFLEYSVHGDDGSNYIHMTGELKISALDTPQQVTFVDTFTRTEDPNPLAGTIDFNAVITPGNVELQYKHNLPMSVTFKTSSKRWLSF